MNQYLYVLAIAALEIICANAPIAAEVITITEGSTSGYTMTDGNTYVVQNSVSFSNSTAGGSGMTVADNATVVLYVPTNVTLTATGANGSGQTGGGAGIRVPATATLIILGEGNVNAMGGNAGNGENGYAGGSPSNHYHGIGGRGGDGGGGAGPAIGGVGGTGGIKTESGPGGAGAGAESMGQLFLLGTISSINVRGNGGIGGAGGGKDSGGWWSTTDNRYYYGGGGGGGGGAGSSPSCAIGGGGSSGGAGGKGQTPQSISGGGTAGGYGGSGGKSKTSNGGNGSTHTSGSYAGGAYGAEGGAGTLYVSSTAAVDVNRAMLSAETHPAAQYAIVFDANGGNITSATSTATATLGCALPDCIPTPTRGGYTFAGWAADQSGTMMWYGHDGTKNLSSYTATANTALYAIWQLDAPTISPASGVVSAWPVSVTISSAAEGATIYYTTDGTEPTEESTVYHRFRVSGRTTIKAIAVKDGLCSEIAVAEYATGQCVNPVITPANGATFNWSGESVSIAWSGEDGVLRYTTDGSDPTAESPIYAGPFTIDDSTVVKAMAFGDQFFDSAVVTANLTRVWVNVATPTIAAASSFTGSETKVAIDCATEGARIYYTLNGNDPNSHSTRYTGPFYVTDSCTVKAYATCYDYLDSAVATQSIEKVWGIGDTVGAPDHAFTTDGDLPFVRVTDNTAPLGESMKSGAITHSQTSTLATTVMGPGTISFQWKTSCEKDPDDLYEWDHAEFWVDGTRIVQLDGETAWQTVTQAISGAGAHTLLWRYVKDDVESEGDDSCWVANYHWVSDLTETQTTEVPVPYVWLRGHFPHTPDEYDAYESTAKNLSANDVQKVWECYVAGVDPTNAADAFRTVISMADGKPVVGWTPDLNEGGTKQERVYHLFGRASLAEGDWTELRMENGEWKTEGCRFFKAMVEMPKD